jgi:hypothetical protein
MYFLGLMNVRDFSSAPSWPPAAGWSRGSQVCHHLDPFLPLLSPGICQHAVLIWAQVVGIVQLPGGDGVCP